MRARILAVTGLCAISLAFGGLGTTALAASPDTPDQAGRPHPDKPRPPHQAIDGERSPGEPREHGDTGRKPEGMKPGKGQKVKSDGDGKPRPDGDKKKADKDRDTDKRKDAKKKKDDRKKGDKKKPGDKPRADERGKRGGPEDRRGKKDGK